MTTLTLGEFTFGHLEIPEAINFGGSQMEYTHMYPGGARVVDAMGVDYDDITWSGLFDGITGMFRAQYLEGLCYAGNSLLCTYGLRNYTVLIKKFTCNFQCNPLPYTITLRIISDNINPITILAPSGFDDALQQDAITALELANLTASGNLELQVAALEAATLAVGTFLGASPILIGVISGYVNTALATVGTVITALNTKLFP